MRLRYPPRRASNSLTKPNHQYLALLGGYLGRVAKTVLLNTINPIFENIIFFVLRGPESIFGWKCWYPEPIFWRFWPHFWILYIATLIFIRNIIISVKIELSLRLNGGAWLSFRNLDKNTSFVLNWQARAFYIVIMQI